MKGRAEKEQDDTAAIRQQFNALRSLFAGLKRARREYPAVESVDWEPLEGGQTLVLRMLYPYEMVRIELADQQIQELCNRAQGLTAGGAQIATQEEAQALLRGL